MSRFAKRRTVSSHSSVSFRRGRLFFIKVTCILVSVVLVGRLFQIQIIDHQYWSARADAQQQTEQVLPAYRGMIGITEQGAPEGVYPLAVTRLRYLVYAVPVHVADAERAARLLAPLLNINEEKLIPILSKEHDPWEPIMHDVDTETASSVRALDLQGVETIPESSRYYPEERFASHVIGFVGQVGDGVRGQYGIEGYYDSVLAGQTTKVQGTKDAQGGFIAMDDQVMHTQTQYGSDILLTIDRRIQYEVCSALRKTVETYGAVGGSAIVMDPKTGRIRAMCNVPDFNPNTYQDVEDPFVYNNASIFSAYEPGSVFKPIAMSAGIETRVVSPESTYVDEGSVRIGEYVIYNSDRVAHGTQNMIDVLNLSLNTGMVHVANSMEPELLKTIVSLFGFGEKTGIELQGEGNGDVSSFSKSGLIYRGTGAFGQGITATPLQLVAAYGAIANGGVLMRPHIVAEVRHHDGTVDNIKPEPVRRVISERTAALISGMLVSVVQDGHGKRAIVPGYTIGGKTGTAQIPRTDAAGYEADETIGTFVGFGPAHDPQFVILTKIERPNGNYFSSQTAAPLFGEIAKFLVQYDNIPPDTEDD